MKPLTDNQWISIAEFASMPVELTLDNVNKDFFVYDREFGLFSVPCGFHQIVMAHLWGFRNNYENLHTVSEDSSELADRWLEMSGTCFFSSMSSKPTVYKFSNLNIAERRILGINGLNEIS